jgi:hypothetical protein
MSTATKIVFIIGLLLLIYGYLCRYFNIYFFWDSKYFGWFGVISGLLLLLIDIRMIRIRQKQNIFFVRVFVAIIIIFLALEGSAIIWLKSSKPYDNLIEAIKTDEVMKAEIGDIRGFNLVPGISIVDIIQVPSSGSLTFVITVRGRKAHKDLEVNIENTLSIDWRVISTQPINYR